MTEFEKKFKPTSDKILLEIPEKKDELVGGIIIPGAINRSRIADRFVVLAVGPKVSETIKPGMTIMLDSEKCGILTKFDGKLYAMCKEVEVSAILEFTE